MNWGGEKNWTFMDFILNKVIFVSLNFSRFFFKVWEVGEWETEAHIKEEGRGGRVPPKTKSLRKENPPPIFEDGQGCFKKGGRSQL